MNIKPYTVNRGTVKRKEDEDSSSGSKAQTQDMQETQREQSAQAQRRQAQTYPRQQYPNGQQTAIDYSHSSVNVAQIITDFQNTTAAIGAPEHIKSEVDTYLGLIEGESLKESPSGKIIQTNLKTASQILDTYIAQTLKKPSDVVEKWIDALFLQKIDFKSDPTAFNPDFQVQLPDKKEPETIIEQPQLISQETPQANPADTSIPQNIEVKKAYLQGRKYSAIKDTQKALSSFEDALKLANETEDETAKPLIFLEVAKIYDGHDLLPQALTLYNKAATNTSDPNIKTKAYYSMAKIYDDAVQFHPAMEHYYASMAYAGESENLKNQTFSLMNIGNLYAERYNANQAKSYFDTAHLMAEETGNNELAAKVCRQSASKMTSLNESKTALDYYKQSSGHFSKTQDSLALAGNYEKSSELMLRLGNTNKAKSLLKKAQNIYTQNEKLQEAFDIEKQLLQL